MRIVGLIHVRARAGASHALGTRCRPNAPCLHSHYGTGQSGRPDAPCPAEQAQPIKAQPDGWEKRPRRVGFAVAAINPFRHISERARVLQSQPADGAARALRGLPAALRTAGEGFFFLNHQIIERKNRIFLHFSASLQRGMPENSGGTRKVHLSHAACHIR